MADETVPAYLYEGPRRDGKTRTIAKNGREKEVLLLGERHGSDATATFPNYDAYRGAFRNGQRHGAGTYTYAETTRNDEEAEQEEENMPPKATYEGEWKNGKKHGQGKMAWASGGKYHGEWADGQRQGHGAFYYTNGDIYCGAWQADKKHGEGTYFYKESSSKVVGTWSCGVLVRGVFSDVHGGMYEGTFTDAGDYGLGTFTSASAVAVDR